MPTNMSEIRKVRVALAVFDDIEDLIRTVEHLHASGVGSSDLWVSASPGSDEHVRAIPGSELPVGLLEAPWPGAPVPLLVRGYDAAIHRWAAAHLQSFPRDGLEKSGTVLIVRISRSIRQLTVSGVLLSSSARVVQLHDMVPEGAPGPSSPAFQIVGNET